VVECVEGAHLKDGIGVRTARSTYVHIHKIHQGDPALIFVISTKQRKPTMIAKYEDFT
jgi:hypothetical protein